MVRSVFRQEEAPQAGNNQAAINVDHALQAALAEVGMTAADVELLQARAVKPGAAKRAWFIVLRAVYGAIGRTVIDPEVERQKLIEALEAQREANLAAIEEAKHARAEVAGLQDQKNGLARDTAILQHQLDKMTGEAKVLELLQKINVDPAIRTIIAQEEIAKILEGAMTAAQRLAEMRTEVAALEAERNRLLGDEKLKAARIAAEQNAIQENERIAQAQAVSQQTDIPDLARDIYDGIANNRYDDAQKAQLIAATKSNDPRAEQLRAHLSVIIASAAQETVLKARQYQIFVDMGVSLNYYPPDQPDKSLVAAASQQDTINNLLISQIDLLSASVRYVVTRALGINYLDSRILVNTGRLIEAGAILTADEFIQLLKPGNRNESRPAELGLVALENGRIEGLTPDVLTKALLSGFDTTEYNHFFGIGAAKLILAIAKHLDTQVDAQSDDGKTTLEKLAGACFKDSGLHDEHWGRFKRLTDIVDVLLERTQLPQQHLVGICKDPKLREYLANHPKIKSSDHTLGNLERIIGGGAPAP